MRVPFGYIILIIYTTFTRTYSQCYCLFESSDISSSYLTELTGYTIYMYLQGHLSMDPNGHSFSSSSVMTYSKVGDEPPKVFQASTQTRRAPGGVSTFLELYKVMKDRSPVSNFSYQNLTWCWCGKEKRKKTQSVKKQ